MMTTYLNEVPSYLLTSSLYRSLVDTKCEDDSGLFKIEPMYFKLNTDINCYDDLVHLLYTLRFWLIDYLDYPYQDIYNFILTRKQTDYEWDDYNSLFETFPELEIIDDIKVLMYAKNRNDVCYTSAKNGHYLCLKFAHENGFMWDEKVCQIAATYGHLDCLQYAHENGCPWDEYTCKYAVSMGHFKCFKYAYLNGCPCGEFICSDAAEAGSLDCLKFAHENGLYWDEHTSEMTASNLNCLRYAHENGCPWDERTCQNAAKYNSIDCLRYAHENGCPWDEYTFEFAVICNNLDCLIYAFDNYCPYNFDILEFASEHSCDDCYDFLAYNLP